MGQDTPTKAEQEKPITAVNTADVKAEEKFQAEQDRIAEEHLYKGEPSISREDYENQGKDEARIARDKEAAEDSLTTGRRPDDANARAERRIADEEKATKQPKKAEAK